MKSTIYNIQFFCRNCWYRNTLQVEYSEIYGKTLKEIQDLISERHYRFCKSAKGADCRIITQIKH